MFGPQLKCARMEAGISQKELATRLFVTQQAVAGWENGRTTPNPDTILKIAEILDVSPERLLGVEEKLNQYTITIKLPPDASPEQQECARRISSMSRKEAFDGLSQEDKKIYVGLLKEALRVSAQAQEEKPTPAADESEDGLTPEFVRLYEQLSDEEKVSIVKQMKGLLAED